MKSRVMIPTVIAMVVLAVAYQICAQQVNPKQSSETAPRDAAGRYQLFQGHYTVNVRGTPFKEDAVFKLDTDTGKVWIYREGQTKDDNIFQRWDGIQE